MSAALNELGIVRLEAVELRPGDILVATLPDNFGPEQCENVQARIREVLGDVLDAAGARLLVKSEAIDLCCGSGWTRPTRREKRTECAESDDAAL